MHGFAAEDRVTIGHLVPGLGVVQGVTYRLHAVPHDYLEGACFSGVLVMQLRALLRIAEIAGRRPNFRYRLRFAWQIAYCSTVQSNAHAANMRVRFQRIGHVETMHN